MILILTALLWLLALLAALARRATSTLWRDLLALGVLLAGTAGFFWRLLFTSNVWMPAGGGDLAQFLYPTYSFAAEWWRRGVVPLWNPYLFGGAPFVGDIQSGLFYPLNVLTFLITSPLSFRDLEFLSVLHFFIAGAGMYAFLRWGRWKSPELANRDSESKVQGEGQDVQARVGDSLSIAASLTGAVAFEFSDLFITHFGNLNLIAVAAWMPLILLLYRRAVTDRRASLAALGGLVLAVAFFAGHLQAFLFIVLALVLLALFQAFAPGAGGVHPDGFDFIGENSEIKTRLPRWARPLLLLALLAAVAFGLAAPVLFPAVEMTQHTLRADYSYEQAAQYSLPPAQLIGLLVPGFFGRGPENTWAPWARVEVGYIGILPLLLALLALVLRRDSATRFFGLVVLVGLGLALGGYGVLHGWFFQFVPGFGPLRAPARFIYLIDFGIAVLAAFGFDLMLHALPRASHMAFARFVRAAPWAFLLAGAATGAMAYTILILGQGQDPVLFARMTNAVNALAFFLLLLGLSVALVVARATRFFRPRAWAVLGLALVFFDLFSLGAYVDVSTEDPTHVYEHAAAVSFLRSQAGLARIDPRGTGVERTWPADTSILYGLYDVNGDNPLVLADFETYWQSLGSRSTALYDLLNVKYLVGRKGVPLDRAKFKLVFGDDPAFDIFENTRVLPRAFIVPTSCVIADPAEARAAVHAPDFDPTKVAVVDQGTALTGSLPVRSAPTTDQVNIAGYGPNEIVLETNSVSPGVLVLSEVYYPGWQAWVDGQETSVRRVDTLFRGVELAPGSHRVRLSYEPLSFKLGVGLFAVTVIAFVGWRVRRWRRSAR